VAQNVANSGATGVGLSGSATAFTVADLTTVWAICDVYESDIAKLSLGTGSEIKVNAYPDKQLTGHISDIGPVLDPSIRTAKVRIELPNPGILKLGMFVTATFQSKTKEHLPGRTGQCRASPARPRLVFVSAGGKQFKRIE